MGLVGTGSQRTYFPWTAGSVNWSYSYWFKTTSSSTQYPIGVVPSAAAPSEDYAALVGGNQVWTGSYISPAGNAAISNNVSYTSGAWFHHCGFIRSNVFRAVYDINAVTRHDNTTNVTTSTPNRCVLGDTYYNGAFANQGIIGVMAHVGLWATELTDAEFASLRVGLTPKKVRMAALIDYWLFANVNNGVKGSAMTDNGSPVYDGDLPRIFS